MLDLQCYVLNETLRDGTCVTLRAVRIDDGPRIRKAFHGLGPETVYTRFFGYKTDVSDAELNKISGVDFDRDVALLVTIGSGEDEFVIGGGSYFAVDADTPPRTAELAFTVEEDYQGRGIASILMRHLARIGRARGLAKLEADVLARNVRMLAVLRSSGMPMKLRREGEIVHVTLSLAAAVV